VSAPLLIVKTGTTLPEIRERRGDFEDWIIARLGWPSERVRVASVYQSDSPPDALPDPRDVAGIVLTGSGAMVSHREAWSEATAAWLRAVPASETPCLGICYGHQLIAHALGGAVGPTPGGREMGTLEVQVDQSAIAGDALLGDLPQIASLQVTHVESVLALPDGALRLATTASDENHAFRLGRCVWGIQFHPEFDADVMHQYIEGRRGILVQEGFDPDAMQAQVGETSLGDEILRRFGEIAASC
jgi:GMP synthase (glutamine-hydrolysing)